MDAINQDLFFATVVNAQLLSVTYELRLHIATTSRQAKAVVQMQQLRQACTHHTVVLI